MRDSLRAYRILAIVMVVMLCTIIVSGAIVRLSNSGLGCSDWPRCEPGHFTSLGTINQRIEQFNRFYSGLIVVPIVISLILAYLARPRRRDLVTLSWVLVVLYLFEAVLGGIAVKVDLQWFSVMTHFLLAITLLGVALFNLERAREHRGTPAAPTTATRRLVVAVWLGVLTIVVLGTLVTAAGPHGGDNDAKRLAIPIADLARIHAVAVDLLVILTLVTAWTLVRTGAPRAVLNAVSVAIGAMVAQGVLGYVQYVKGIPPVLVGFHVFGAVIVFGAVQQLALSLTAPVADAAEVPIEAPVAVDSLPRPSATVRDPVA
jgi:cytochrome c oxidase assembly protein subunit 15